MEKDESDIGPHSRPLSYYENTSDNRRSTNNNMKECKFSDSLTQLHCLNTTVPQNIGRQNIGGKHTPTRNSLRHSRMIVLNRSGQVTSNNTPLFLKYSKFVKTILMVTILLGLSVCLLFLWLHIWSPNLDYKDYWSTIPVLVSGVVGVLFVHICPKVYNRNFTPCKRSVKHISIAVSVVAAASSLIVFVFTLIHLFNLFSMECSAFDTQDTTCVCKSNSSNTTSSSYHYVDLNCSEVRNILTSVILYTCIANIIITVLKLVYLYFHWASRNVYVYCRVPLNENTYSPPKTDR